MACPDKGERVTTPALLCPVCDGPFNPDPKYGYILDGDRVSTCEACHGTLMKMMLESKLGRRELFWKARGTEAMCKRIHQAVLEARGLLDPVLGVGPFQEPKREGDVS